MATELDQSNLHRTAKYFMDRGSVDSHEDAMHLLHSFGLTIHVGIEVSHSVHHQNALLTLVNVARRTFLGGIEIVGPCHSDCISPFAPNCSLISAIENYGGRLVTTPNASWPAAVIGSAKVDCKLPAAWQLTWQGWSGGVTPLKDDLRLNEKTAISLAPVLAAAVCAA